MSQLPDHLDIHLIRILYLLLCEKNVSRVALKLNQPQPSISASLRKLRDLTGDPLLVRGTRGMVPTPHGESLMHPARLILDEAEKLFMKKIPFIPATESRVFSIASPDYISPQFFIELATRMRKDAPRSQLIIHSLGPNSDYKKMLADGDLNIVIGNWDDPPPHFHQSTLFEDTLVCLMRTGSAFSRRTPENGMTLDDYMNLPHLAPSQILPGYPGHVDTWLLKHDLQRHIVLESAYFNLLPQIVAQTDLALTTGSRYGAYYQRFIPLKAFQMPAVVPPLKFYQLWHERGHQSPEHRWFREMILAAATDAGLR